MRVFSKITDLTKTYPNIVVALGTFDGVHMGHQSIIRQAIGLAQSIQGISVIFTFSNHPLSIITPEKVPLQINDTFCKERDMEQLGVDILVNVPFTKELLKVSPLDFLQLLKDNFSPKYIVVGPNYSFGYKGEGTPKFLLQKGKEYGFNVEIHPVVHWKQHFISSTKIRQLIEAGHLSLANELLGKPFMICSKVIHGDERGRVIGFPTANLAIGTERVMLPDGVYAAKVLIREKEYGAVANIGTNPTFDGCYRRIEVHIIDFNHDIYDELIYVKFLMKIREEKKFLSLHMLIEQIDNDIVQTKKYFNLH